VTGVPANRKRGSATVVDDESTTSGHWIGARLHLTAMSSDLNPTTPAESIAPAESTKSTEYAVLRSLQSFAPRQEERIKRLIGKGRFQDLEDPDWKTFFKSAWGGLGGNPDAFEGPKKVQRGIDPIDDSLLLPDIVPDMCNVMPKFETLDECWYFDCEDILVRSEYKEAEQAVLSACAGGEEAIVVTGQPGIGLSLSCLHYGILKSLHQGNPSFYFASSCCVSRSNFRQQCKTHPDMSCFSARRV
jgi:hypothetical protein